jgi:hypothetical protein
MQRLGLGYRDRDRVEVDRDVEVGMQTDVKDNDRHGAKKKRWW